MSSRDLYQKNGITWMGSGIAWFGSFAVDVVDSDGSASEGSLQNTSIWKGCRIEWFGILMLV